MPKKTIYVSDDDLPLFERALAIAGGNLSSTIAAALRRYVEAHEGQQDGYNEITVVVGTGPGRRQRFSGVLIGEWNASDHAGTERMRVYLTRRGQYALHHERSERYTLQGPGADDHTSGWRSWVGYLSSDQQWSVTPANRALTVVAILDELRPLVPEELFTIVSAHVEPPVIEDLDI